MKLYDWQFLCPSYYPGRIIVVAKNLDQARKAAMEVADDIDLSYVVKSIAVDPEIHSAPFAVLIWGGD